MKARDFMITAIALAALFILCMLPYTSLANRPPGIVGDNAKGNALTPTVCPIPTQEILFVEPVTSPTNRLSQVIHVHINNGEAITVTSESGSFAGVPPSVEIALIPATVHHLTVFAKVRDMGPPCHYGGYTLSTSLDRFGQPLTIEQQLCQEMSATGPIPYSEATQSPFELYLPYIPNCRRIDLANPKP